MSLHLLLVLVALGAALVAFAQSQARMFPLIALIVSGLQALLAFGFVSLSVRGLSLGLILGAALLGAGVGIWSKATGKLSVSCAAIITLVGGIQVARILL